VLGIDRIHLLGRELRRLSIRILAVSSSDTENGTVGWSSDIEIYVMRLTQRWGDKGL
jgi:hypothetical protein